MNIRNVIATAIGTALAVSVWATPAGASTSIHGRDPQRKYNIALAGDIREWSYSDDGTTVTATVKTSEFEDPIVGDNWRHGRVKIVWVLGGFQLNGESLKTLTMTNVDGDVVTDGGPFCSGTPSWSAAESTYSVRFFSACMPAIGTAHPIGVRIFYNDGDETWNDFAELVSEPYRGYWMLEANGGVHSFGRVWHLGSLIPAAAGTAVDIEPTPSKVGYWILEQNGTVHAHSADHFGNATLSPGERATAISVTPSGDGYWIFTDKGRAITFGDAQHFGDMSGVALHGPVLDAIPTPSGNGYYMVASDGGIFAFGDAVFYGSMGGIRLNAPVQSLVPDPDGTGYWLVASDGGVFAFEAGFMGSMGGMPLNKPVTGMVPFGNGYLMVGEDGGIFNFSDKPFLGSLGSNPPDSPIVAVAAA